jgi:hypothetical protein
MVRLRRLLSVGLTVAFSVTSALVMGMAAPRADIGLNPVTIDCGDGAPIHASVNLAELAKLERVIQAMVADPSDPTVCSMTQNSQPTASETHTFVIGEGTYGSVVNCELRFRVKASVDEYGNVRGFQHVTAPSDNCGVPGAGPGAGTLKANVTCVAVVGNVGEMRGIVSESTGLFATTTIDIHPGDVMFTQAQENAPPVPDDINQYKDPPGTEQACVAQIDSVSAFPLDSGDIEVHN